MGGLTATQLRKGESMKYVILSDTVVKGDRVTAGDVVELDLDLGRQLVGYGKAEEYKGKPKKETNRSVGLEESDTPKPKKRTKK
jgi:hypothetical protein